jgi:hypothetical protein
MVFVSSRMTTSVKLPNFRIESQREGLGISFAKLKSPWNLALAIQEILNRPQWKFLRLDLIGPEELPGGYRVDCD